MDGEQHETRGSETNQEALQKPRQKIDTQHVAGKKKKTLGGLMLAQATGQW